jgi:hypothetical protein
MNERHCLRSQSPDTEPCNLPIKLNLTESVVVGTGAADVQTVKHVASMCLN